MLKIQAFTLILLLFPATQPVLADTPTTRPSTPTPTQSDTTQSEPQPTSRPATRLLTPREQLKQRYIAAILDASQPWSYEVTDTLWPITKQNRRLRWKTIHQQLHVLMVTWTGYNGYPATNTAYKTPSKFDLWVTPAPQMQDFCRRIAPKQRDLRLKQWLGLNPFRSKTLVVEFWVPVKALFRPCTSPDITTRSCPLEISPKVPILHLQWFQQQRRWAWLSKPVDKGAPWTGLGYTYDWGSTLSPHIGASEYVIRRKATVQIHSKQSTADYCRSSKAASHKGQP